MFPFQSQRCERRLYPTHTKKEILLAKTLVRKQSLRGKNLNREEYCYLFSYICSYPVVITKEETLRGKNTLQAQSKSWRENIVINIC